MKIKPSRPLVFILLAVISLIVTFSPISPRGKLFAVMFIGTSTTFMALFELGKFIKWVIDGFEIQGRAIAEIVEVLRSLIQTVVIYPDKVKELEKAKAGENPLLPNKGVEDVVGKLTNTVNTLSNKVMDLEKNLHPFRISLYSIFVGVSVAVALGIIIWGVSVVLP